MFIDFKERYLFLFFFCLIQQKKNKPKSMFFILFGLFPEKEPALFLSTGHFVFYYDTAKPYDLPRCIKIYNHHDWICCFR